MSKTIAEAIREEAAVEARLLANRETLLRLLRLRFKKIPSSVEATIEATRNRDTLNEWLDAFATAKKLGDIPFDHPRSAHLGANGRRS
jgi:hypothetical protein